MPDFNQIARVAVLGLALITVTALAADKTREVKLTTEQAIILVEALGRLDGYDRVVSDGGRERVVKQAYQLDIGARMAIARAIPALQYVTKPAQEAYQSRIMELSGGTGTLDPSKSEDAPKLARINAEWKEILAKVNTFNLPVLTEADLKLKENSALAPTTISALLPILSE